MKSILVLLLSIIAFSVQAQPKIKVDNPVHDFGTFIEGADSTHVFTIKNEGKSPLIILSVSKPCGCTTPSFSQAPIPPNKTGTVTVKYASADHPGYFRKNLQVKTNDRSKDVVTVTITGVVKKKE